MDPDEFVLEQGPKAFADRTAEAGNFIDFYVERSLGRSEGDELENKIKTANVLAALVGKIPDPIRQGEYIRLIASRLDVKPEDLQKASQKSGLRDRIEEESTRFERKLQREEKEQMWLAKMLIERPENIEIVRERLDAKSIQYEALRQLIEAIFGCEGGQINERALFDKLDSEEAQRLLSKLMFEGDMRESPLYPPQWWHGHKEGRGEKKKFEELIKQIAEAEKKGDIELLNKLLIEKHQDKERLTRIKGDLSQVSVDRSAETVAGG
jgi:DNA primase